MSEKLSIPWKAKVFAATSLAIAGAVSIECGGSDKKPEVIGAQATATESFTATVVLEPTKIATPEKTPTPEQTATPVLPTATSTKEATQVPIKTVLDQGVNPTTIEAVRGSLDGFYAKNPNYSRPRSEWEGVLNDCEKGDPQDAGNAKLISKDRESSCMSVVAAAYSQYLKTGDEGLLAVATGARSYFITAYPALQAEFDALLVKSGVK